jgi:hypothetical protein
MLLKDLLQKIMENGGNDLDFTEEGITKAALEKGISAEEIAEALDNFDGFPLDEDDLENITGGISSIPARANSALFSPV